jgi:hypothetical protein
MLTLKCCCYRLLLIAQCALYIFSPIEEIVANNKSGKLPIVADSRLSLTASLIVPWPLTVHVSNMD